MKNKSTYSDFLRQENELTKLKIQAEFGLEMHDGNGLNPAIENIWLNNILNYERAAAKNEQVTIREKLGNPTFKPVEQVSDDEMVEALHSLMETLLRGNIVIDSLAGASDREMYRFITQELLEHETDKNTPTNMLVCFIYEEFHPNHEYDIRRRANDLFEALASEKEIDFDYHVSSGEDGEAGDIKCETLKRKLSLFKNAFDSVSVDKYEITSVEITDDTAEVAFDFSLSLLPAESRTKHGISGSGKFRLINQYDWWSIFEIDMKGVV